MGEAVMPRERSVVGIDADDGAIRNRLAQPGLVDKWRQEVVTATQIKPVRRARNLGQERPRVRVLRIHETGRQPGREAPVRAVRPAAVGSVQGRRHDIVRLLKY